MQATKISADLKQERVINRFLKEIVFPYLSKSKELDIVWLRDEPILDLSGVDIMLNGAYVDLKAHRTKDALRPQRFSFELQTRHRLGDSASAVTDICNGWLIGKRKVTEKYLFYYYNENYTERTTDVSLILIDRSKLLSMFEERGLPISESVAAVRRKSNHIAAQQNGSIKYYFQGIWDISLTHSLQLPEQPLNIVVKGKTIMDICDWACSFTVPVLAAA